MNPSNSPVGRSFPRTDPKLPVWSVSPANGQYFINSVAVSADGQRVVGGTFYHVYGGTQTRREDVAGFLSAASPGASTDDGTFGTYCYDAKGNPLWKNEFTGWQGVYWVAISADGSHAAAGGNQTQSPQAGFVRAFDGASGAVQLDFPTAQRVNQVALSADGAWLVSAAETLILFRFDPLTAAYVKADVFTPAPNGSDSNAVVSVGISADGATIVFSDYAGHIGVLANTGGQLSLSGQYQMASSFCHMVALTTDGTFFAAGGAGGTFYLCNTGRFITEEKPTYAYDTGLTDPVYGVAVADGGGVFAGVVNSGADAGFVYVVSIVDFATQLQAKFATARNPNSASLNLVSGLLAVADGHPDNTPGDFYVFDGITAEGNPIVVPQLAWQYQTSNMSWPIKISTDGQAVVAGSDDSFIYYFTAR
jgi:WD40 repeat protein